MHAPTHEPPVDIRLSEADAIALHYYRAAQRDGWAALVQAVTDALADLDAAERQAVERSRLVSHGYARCRPAA